MTGVIQPAVDAVQSPDPPGTDVAVRGSGLPAPRADENGTVHVPTPIAGYELRFRPGQQTLDEQQLAILSPLGMGADWDPRQVMVFLLTYLNRGLDPWSQEVYLMRYRDSTMPGGYRYVPHTGINGFRKAAEATGEYRGQAGPYWCGEDGEWREIWPNKVRAPYAAKVGIMRVGFDGVIWAVAHYDEFVPMIDEWETQPDGHRRRTGRKVPSPMWRPAEKGGKAAFMLAKVAEAQAFRKAFPNRFGNLYVPEEFARMAEDERANRVAAEAEAARARRAEAMKMAEQAAARPVVTVPSHPRPAAPAPEPKPDLEAEAAASRDEARWLLAEQQVQATILDTTVTALSNRWVKLHRTNVEDMTLDQVRQMVHTARAAVVEKLRQMGHVEEAECYEQAPDAAPVEMLFGRSAEAMAELVKAVADSS